jgi:uncharacterized protein
MEISGTDQLSLLTGADVDALSLGAEVLGSGGGGKVDNHARVARVRGPAFRVRVADVADPDIGSLTAVGYIGSTMVIEEKMPSGAELPAAVSALERWSGAPVQAVMPMQVGGMISLAAALLASELSRPLLDADLVGRATPRLDQLSLHTAAQGWPAPLAAVTPSGLSAVIDTYDPADMESAVRGVIARSGGWAAFALGPFDLAEVRDLVVAGSITRAVQIGRVLGLPGRPAAEAAVRLGGRIAARGRLLEVTRRDDQLTFVHGSAALQNPDTGQVARLEMGSEYLYLTVDGEPAASVPSIICALDARTRQPVETVDLRPGLDVDVLVLPPARFWTVDEDRARLVDPRSYGIDADIILPRQPCQPR